MDPEVRPWSCFEMGVREETAILSLSRGQGVRGTKVGRTSPSTSLVGHYRRGSHSCIIGTRDYLARSDNDDAGRSVSLDLPTAQS